MSLRIGLMATCAALFFAHPPTVNGALTLFGGGGIPGSLYSIDMTTGARTEHIGFPPPSPVVTHGISGLTYNSDDGYLYATPRHVSPSATLQDYFRINPKTFDVDVLQYSGLTFSTSLDAHIESLEYDRSRKIFWGTVPAYGSIIQLDPSTGVAEVVGNYSDPLDMHYLSGIALDQRHGVMYGVQDSIFPTRISTLVTIDLDTFAVTPIGTPGLGLGLYDVDSLAFNPQDEMLYAIHDGLTTGDPAVPLGQLLKIDPTTGAASFIGSPTGVSERNQGLAFVVPELSSLPLLGMGFFSIVVGRVREVSMRRVGCPKIENIDGKKI